MRIVSLACSNTEIVSALGCAHMLVGVDGHSDHPPDVVARLPKVGPDLEIDIQAVAELEPDLVLATLTVPGHETVIEGLEAAGLPFIAPSPHSIPDVYRDLREVGERLGVPGRAEDLVTEMAAATGVPDGIETAEELEAHRVLRESRLAMDSPRVLVQWWPKPSIVPGRRSWTHDVLLAAGLRNVLGHEDVISRPVPDDEVAELKPDAIVISWCGIEPRNYRPDVVLGKDAWAQVPAVREGRVVCVPEAFMGRPGPRLVDGVATLRSLLG